MDNIRQIKSGNTQNLTMENEEIGKGGVGQFELGIMMMCYEQRLMTRRQLMRWVSRVRALKNMESAKSAIIRSMRHLIQERLVEVFPIFQTKEREAYKLTSKGAALICNVSRIGQFSLEPRPVILNQVGHDLIATDIRLTWEEILIRGSWLSEGGFWFAEGDQIPDALLCFSRGANENVAISIEVELTQKSRARYEKKFQDFENSTNSDHIFYFSPNETITKTILEVSKEITDCIYVCQIDEFFSQREKAQLVSHRDRYRIHFRIPCWGKVEL